MTIGCNIWMICLILIWFFYGLSRMFQFPQFVWPLSYSAWNVFNNFLLIDATDRSKISSDQKLFFIALSLYPLSFFVNTPFKERTLIGRNRIGIYKMKEKERIKQKIKSVHIGYSDYRTVVGTLELRILIFIFC